MIINPKEVKKEELKGFHKPTYDEQRFLDLLDVRRASSRHKEDSDVVMDTSGSYGSRAKG